MRKLITYIKDSFDEVIHKVTWPKFGEVQSTAVLVLVSTLVFTVLVAAIDYAFKLGSGVIYK